MPVPLSPANAVHIGTVHKARLTQGSTQPSDAAMTMVQLYDPNKAMGVEQHGKHGKHTSIPCLSDVGVLHASVFPALERAAKPMPAADAAFDAGVPLGAAGIAAVVAVAAPAASGALQLGAAAAELVPVPVVAAVGEHAQLEPAALPP